jgi:hypothetical protein
MSWSLRMSAWLCQMGLWRIINKSWKQPKLDLIVATKDANGKVIALTAEQHTVNAKIKLGHGASLKRCVLAKEKATGDICAHLSPSQHTLIRPYEEDPAAMWGKLLKIYSQQIPSMRFGAYNAIFSIVQQPDELLQAVAGCASGALACIEELCPVRALPCNVYGNFVLLLMRQKTLTRADIWQTPLPAWRLQQVPLLPH